MNERRRPAHLPALVAVGLLAACGQDPFGPLTTVEPDYEALGFVFTATASVSGDRTLETTVTVRNDNDVAAEITILGGPCGLRARLYDNANGSLVWSAFAEDQDCPDIGRVISLAPGAELLLQQSVQVDVSGGTYLATVTIEHDDLVELSAGLVTFP